MVVVTSATKPPRVGVVMAGLMLVMLPASLDQTIVSTALPTIVRDFGGPTHISWVVMAYLLAVTVVTPLYGQARRSGRASGRPGCVRFRLSAVRARTRDDRADRVPADSGPRRRWADGE